MSAVARVTHFPSGDITIDVQGDNYEDVFQAFFEKASTFETRRVAHFSHVMTVAPAEKHIIIAFLG